MSNDLSVIVYDERIKARFLEVVDDKTYHREIIFALQAFQNNPKLQECNRESIRNAIVNIALTGATLNPIMQQAFLIPRKGKCCLDFSYRGLCKLAIDSGTVYDIDAFVVLEGEEFHFEYGLNPVLIHSPKMFNELKDKKIICAYAIAILHHGIKKFVVLDREKLDRARKSAQTQNIWHDHEDEMCKKTAVKLLYKLLPQTEKMSVAVAALNEHEGIDTQEKAKDIEKRFGYKRPEEQTSGNQSLTDGVIDGG